MAHKKLDPKVIPAIDRAIEAHLNAIKSAEVYRADRDRESIKLLLSNMRSLLEITKEKKDNGLLLSTTEGANFARFLLGRQKVYEEVILSFEDAENYEKHHKKEIEALEHERTEYENYPLAD